MDLAARTEVLCRRCNKKGHFARNCKAPPSSSGPTGKSRGKGARFMSSYGGEGASPSISSATPCPGCGKLGHAKDLAPPRAKKKVQGVEEEEIDCGGIIRLCAVEVVGPSCSSSLSLLSSYVCEKETFEENPPVFVRQEAKHTEQVRFIR